MGWKNKRDLQAYSDRKSERYANYGRELEIKVESLLVELKKNGHITNFLHHPANSEADCEGRDFTIWKEKLEKSFGVTISMRSWHRAKLKYPEIPQFCFPLNVNTITIERKVLGLLQNESDPI